MKIKGHQSFYIRRGWIHKGLKEIKQNPKVFSDKDLVLTDIFGIGSNMVLSLKYWLKVLGLVEQVRSRNKYIYKLTDIGELIYKYDKYLENIETWELLHYKISTNEDIATTWYWFFNIYEGVKFNRLSLFNALQNYIESNYEKSVVERSIKDDITCLLNTYLTREITSPEDNMESPFAQLGLIEMSSIKGNNITYKKSKKYFPNSMLLYYILLEQAGERELIDLEEIINGRESICKIFNLDFSEVLGILDNLQNEGKIKFIRTAGLNYISIIKNESNIEVLENIYR